MLKRVRSFLAEHGSTLFVVVALLAIVGNVVGLIGAKPSIALEDRALASTVFVKVSETGHGSGFVVGTDRILTAAHVVKGKDKIAIKFHNTGEIEAKVLWIGQGANDVALLQADTRGRPALPLACAPAKRGTEVMAFGHPKFLTNIATYGRIAGFNTDKDLAEGIQDAVLVDITIAPGNSGGPILNKSGQVVGTANGIVIATANPFTGGAAGTGHTIMLPSSVICGLLNK